MVRTDRRMTFSLAIALIVALVVAACAGPAAPAPTAAPAPKATTAAAPAAQATTAPAAQATTAPAAKKDTVVVAHSGVGAFPTSLDNANFTSWYNAPFNLFDTLVRLEFEGEKVLIKPSIAESWKVVDDKTYEFKIRKGVKFHNGETLKASDVAFSLNRLLDKENKYPVLAYFGYFNPATVKDDDTVVITSLNPYAPTFHRLTFLTIVSEKVFKEYGKEKFGSQPVGTGPYKLVEWVRGERVTLEAFQDYWQGAPKIKKLIFRDVKEGTTRLALLESGEVDVINNVPPPNLAQVQNNKNVDVKTVRSTRMVFGGYNTLRAEPNPYRDVRVRQAINMAVDWDSIIKNVIRGLGFKVPSAVGGMHNGYDAALAPLPFDPKKAKELMTAAGFANGFETTFDGPAGQWVFDKEVAQAIAGQLEKNLGIKSQLMLTDWGNFWEKFLGKRIEGLYMMSCGALIADADLCTQLHFHSKVRGIYYNSPKIDALLDDQAQTVDVAKRAEKLKTLQKALQDEAPFIFGYDEGQVYAIKKGLKWSPRADELMGFYTAEWQ